MAQYLSHVENAHRLREINLKIDGLIQYRQLDQRREALQIWITAQGFARTEAMRRSHVLASEIEWRSQLFGLRWVLEEQMSYQLNTAPKIKGAFSASRFESHTVRFASYLRLLQVALFAEYAIAVATGSIANFRDRVTDELSRVVSIVRQFEAKRLSKNIYAGVDQIGFLLNSYRSLLNKLGEESGERMLAAPLYSTPKLRRR
jgi:hypothetical protein